MSRQAQLPPRYPFQKKAVARQEEPVSTASNNGLQPRHCKSISQSFITEEHPSWFEDLLTDADSDCSVAVHRRSASDSFTFLDDHEKLSGLGGLKTPVTSASSESDGGLESACAYGPNSPRRKGQLTFPDNAVVSALSEFVSQAPLQYFEHSSYASEIAQEDKLGNSCNDTDATKRHQGKWSRVRKMEYINELERTVNLLQGFETELAVKVSALHQQRATLLVENSMLKQQMIRLQQEKLCADGEYQSLTKEAERLKAYLGFKYPNKGMRGNSYGPASAGTEVSWEMLDMQKLDLGRNR